MVKKIGRGKPQKISGIGKLATKLKKDSRKGLFRERGNSDCIRIFCGIRHVSSGFLNSAYLKILNHIIL